MRACCRASLPAMLARVLRAAIALFQLRRGLEVEQDRPRRMARASCSFREDTGCLGFPYAQRYSLSRDRRARPKQGRKQTPWPPASTYPSQPCRAWRHKAGRRETSMCERQGACSHSSLSRHARKWVIGGCWQRPCERSDSPCSLRRTVPPANPIAARWSAPARHAAGPRVDAPCRSCR